MQMIRTERLSLVPVTPNNSDVLWRVLQEPDLREFQDLPEVNALRFREMVAERPRELRPGAYGRFEWIIYADGHDEPIGWLSLRVSDRTKRRGEIGYSIVRQHRKRGYATEAVTALIAESAGRAHIKQLRAYCVPDNDSSRTVLRKLGFVEEGILPKGATVNGLPVDVIGHVLDVRG